MFNQLKWRNKIMQKIKFEFHVSTHFVNSTAKDIVELEFEDDATEEEIEDEVAEAYKDWMNNEVEGGWYRV